MHHAWRSLRTKAIQPRAFPGVAGEEHDRQFDSAAELGRGIYLLLARGQVIQFATLNNVEHVLQWASSCRLQVNQNVASPSQSTGLGPESNVAYSSPMGASC